jgi:hypothetical protein
MIPLLPLKEWLCMFWCFIFDNIIIPYILLYSSIYEKEFITSLLLHFLLISCINLELKFTIMSMAQMLLIFVKNNNNKHSRYQQHSIYLFFKFSLYCNRSTMAVLGSEIS